MDWTQPASQAKRRHQGGYPGCSQLEDQMLVTGFHEFMDSAKRNTSVADLTLKALVFEKSEAYRRS
jgi:hypothetical protein